MSDEGRLVAGRYRIERRIGTGAMGAVWQAHDDVLGRTVAIKQLLLQPGLDHNEAEDAKQRTMREGRIAARLHHPNAISVFDVVTDDNGQPCLVMEYLASTSLAELLRDRKTLPPREVARIGAQIAAALKEAHAVGIVHRDIKPGNILLADNGTVKITDFGISRAKDDVTVTKTGMIAGTPAYLAPEVAVGGDPGPEADVFSLGSTLYAACEGQPPFGLSENTLSLLHAVAAGQINPPRQSGPLASVLAVLLHPEIQHRPTAEEAEELLAAVARGETPLGGPDDETQYSPSGGAIGGALGAAGAAAGATRAFSGDELSHSGTLGSPSDQFYDEYDDYSDDPYAATAAYPTDDYDRQGATRAVPAGYDGYEGYEGYDAEPQPAPVDDEDEKPGRWKVPAAIGAVVVAGLVALGFWLFSPADNNTKNTTETNQPIVPPPVTSSSVVTTTESPTPSITPSSKSEAPSSSTSSSRTSTSSSSKEQTSSSKSSSSKTSTSKSSTRTTTSTSTSEAEEG